MLAAKVIYGPGKSGKPEWHFSECRLLSPGDSEDDLGLDFDNPTTETQDGDDRKQFSVGTLLPNVPFIKYLSDAIVLSKLTTRFAASPNTTDKANETIRKIFGLSAPTMWIAVSRIL